MLIYLPDVYGEIRDLIRDINQEARKHTTLVGTFRASRGGLDKGYAATVHRDIEFGFYLERFRMLSKAEARIEFYMENKPNPEDDVVSWKNFVDGEMGKAKGKLEQLLGYGKAPVKMPSGSH